MEQPPKSGSATMAADIPLRQESYAMKIKVITREDGEIVGTVRASTTSYKSHSNEEMQAEIVPMPSQRMHEIDVPDDVIGIENPDELHRRIKTYLPKRA